MWRARYGQGCRTWAYYKTFLSNIQQRFLRTNSRYDRLIDTGNSFPNSRSTVRILSWHWLPVSISYVSSPPRRQSFPRVPRSRNRSWFRNQIRAVPSTSCRARRPSSVLMKRALYSLARQVIRTSGMCRSPACKAVGDSCGTWAGKFLTTDKEPIRSLFGSPNGGNQADRGRALSHSSFSG